MSYSCSEQPTMVVHCPVTLAVMSVAMTLLLKRAASTCTGEQLPFMVVPTKCSAMLLPKPFLAYKTALTALKKISGVYT